MLSVRKCYFVIKNIIIFFLISVINVLGQKKGLLMIKGHTYSEYSPNYWYCTKKKSAQCNAKARTDRHGHLIYVKNEHTHLPPAYHITNTGQYVKIS
ncbi:hypothetical protein RR46_03788 [Papilio xuthus]|uniref:FLYWCH-type domain-containing protein n=1 Tax=Papilio xuthus TaxID=66420 RepID=A0A194Q260_PAPXU|nr:hypothetical protein RR46_03788 [Papilio xuthus]